MSNATPNHAALHRASAAEWIARREESIKRIGALLADGELTVVEIAEEFNMPTNTAYGHMTYMASLGLAHCTGELVGHRRLWAKGPKPVAVEKEDAEERCAKTVRAQQIGVQRDSLVAALFGPAKQGVSA